MVLCVCVCVCAAKCLIAFDKLLLNFSLVCFDALFKYFYYLSLSVSVHLSVCLRFAMSPYRCLYVSVCLSLFEFCSLFLRIVWYDTSNFTDIVSGIWFVLLVLLSCKFEACPEQRLLSIGMKKLSTLCIYIWVIL